MSAAAKPKLGEEKKPRRRVKKVAGHGGHHGGAWKVAYADFVTAMMALFLVLWLLSQADQKLKESIANYFRSPGAFNTVRGGILPGGAKVGKEPVGAGDKDEEQAFLAAAMQLRNKFASRPEFSTFKDQVKVDVTGEGLRIQVVDKADKVSFESGSAALNDSARAILSEIAKSVCGMSNAITIGGHTDHRPFSNGSAYTNWELSADRANAARRALEAGCVKPEQIRRVIGFADTDPLTPTDVYAAANRRISITVLRSQPNTKGQPNAKPDAAGAKEAEPKDAGSKVSRDSERPAAKQAEGEAPEKAAGQDKRKSAAKLKADGEISVGTPDQIPAKVKRLKEE